MGTLADKLIYLGATKTDLRESINTILGTTLDETTPFRQYGARAELKSIQSMSGIGPVFVTDEYAPGTSTPLLYEDSAGTTPASVSGVVGLINSLTGGLSAVQATTANKSTLRVTPSTGIRWLDANTATAAMTVTLPSLPVVLGLRRH